MASTPLYYAWGYCVPSGSFVTATTPDGVELLSRQEIQARFYTMPPQTEQYHGIYGFPTTNPETDAPVLGHLCFDIDDGDDLEHALEETRRVVQALLDVVRVPVDAVRIYYSGRKGFHIMVSAKVLGCEAHPDLPAMHKAIAGDLQASLRLTALDRTLYTRTHHLRVPNTWNAKGERYKIPITLDTLRLLDGAQIRELAQSPQPEPNAGEISAEELAPVRAWWQKALDWYHTEYATRERTYDPTKIQRLPDGVLPPCIELLQSEALRDGDGRNSALYSLACFWHGQGKEPRQIEAILGQVNAGYFTPLDKRDLATIVTSAVKNPKPVGCRSAELESRCPGRTHCVYFKKQKPTQVSVDAGMQITDLPNGFTAVMPDGWQFVVTDIKRRKGALTCTLKTNGPNGFSRLSTVNLLSPTAVGKYLSGSEDGKAALETHLQTLAEHLTSTDSTVATAQRCDTNPNTKPDWCPIKVDDNRYWIWRGSRDEGNWENISNFTIEVTRLLTVLDNHGDPNCVRELVLITPEGNRSQPRKATKSDLATKSRWVEFCGGAGDYSFTGTEQDLQVLKEHVIFTAQVDDQAYLLDHIGWVDHRILDGAFLWGNAGVYQQQLFIPEDGRVYNINGTRMQIRGIEVCDQSDTPRNVPMVCTDFVNDPEGLRSVKRRILDLLKASLRDERGWLVLGLVMASAYMPEIIHEHSVFPGLFFVGPMGSGKNTLMRWITNCVSSHAFSSLNLPHTRIPAISRQLAFYSGYPVIFDEFRNSVGMDEKVHLLRNIYDRIGRSVAVVGNNTMTNTLPVRGWIIVAGQDVGSDAAFNSRFILSVMGHRFRSSDQKVKQELDDLTRQYGSAIFLQMMLEKSPAEWATIKEMIANGQEYYMAHMSGVAKERVALNYAIAVAGWNTAFGDVATDEEKGKLLNYVLAESKESQAEFKEHSEAAGFLADMASMMATGALEMRKQYTLRENMTVLMPDNTTRLVPRALCIWMKGTLDAWKYWQGRRSEVTWTEKALRIALQNEIYYVREGVTISFGNVTHRCMVLDLQAMPEGMREDIPWLITEDERRWSDE